ncbi:hypothetical protein SDC9_76897 [bioreactor metagenome]|uniref:Uncharacterized protein n=1 Tax=bioreactor metagenome TaxID=1076179 RepID=A0A644YPV9_9ZZZZ
MGRHGDNRNSRHFPLLFDPPDSPDRLHAVHFGHLDIEQHGIVAVFFQGFQGLPSALRRIGRHSRPTEHGGDNPAVNSIVLHRKNPQVFEPFRRGALFPGKRHPVFLSSCGRGGFEHFYREPELRSRSSARQPGRAHRTGCSAHEFRKLPRNCQAQPRSAVFSRRRGIKLGKFCEEPFRGEFRHSYSCIRHGKPEGQLPGMSRSFLLPDRDPYPPFFGELDGVVQKVGQNLPDSPPVTPHTVRDRQPHRSGKAEPLGRGPKGPQGEHFVHEFPEVEILFQQFKLPRLHL